MKILVLLLLVVSSNSYASGCFPDDVQLVEEKVLAVFPENYKGSVSCKKINECSIYAYKDNSGMWREFYRLYPANQQQSARDQQLENVELKVYQQFFSSSCTDLYRVVVGFDLDGKRFRTEIDLLEL